jgi:hypothetical protein
LRSLPDEGLPPEDLNPPPPPPDTSSSASPAHGAPAEAPGDVPHLDTMSGVGDLDRLIDELESARITPDPDLDAIPAPDLDDDVGDLVSETLGRIYAAQKQYRAAAQIYFKLSAQEPEKARSHLQNASKYYELAEEQAAAESGSSSSEEA